MARRASPSSVPSVPPTLPPKDSSGSLSSAYRRPPSTYSTNNGGSSYINHDLAEAVRDSVQFGSKQSSPNLDFSDPSGFKQPSLGVPIARRTPSPRPILNNGEGPAAAATTTTASANRMSYVPTGQPQLPSERIISALNPFESDEIEPPPGPVRPPGSSRQKLTRAQTAAAGNASNPSTSISSANLLQRSPGAKTRPRRSMSSGSYGLDANGRELTAGQKKALEDKKGGKHVDVIDTWDPTGLGSAMWHHSGPYDAAAPSRNQNQPQTKAPMRAFNAQAAAQAQAQAQAQAGLPAPISPSRSNPAVSLASPPIPPAKDNNDGPTRRARAALDRKPTSSRRTSGGLTGQYSTSMPTSGGYFPEMNAEPTDEAELARRDRQRQREEKRRALKAAWGIDTPEPFEDFGVSPGEGGHVDLGDDVYSPSNGAVPLPPGRAARSPGIRMAGAPPPIPEDLMSPSSESGALSSYRNAPAHPGGVKRTKSLMQKIKTMRGDHNKSPLRSSSPRADPMPTSPTEELPSPTDKNEPVQNGRKGIFGRSGHSTSPRKSAYTMAFEEEMPLPEAGDFVFVESPNTKTRAATAQRESGYKERGLSGDNSSWNLSGALNGNGSANDMETLQDMPVKNGLATAGSGLSSRPSTTTTKNRVKNLPTPPVMPVLPDFDDLVPSRTMSRTGGYEGGEGVKRKTSMVKKLKDRIK